MKNKTKLTDETTNNIKANAMFSGWQVCPKCSGQGTVSKPPYLAGDINHWSCSQGQYECNVCNSKKIINIVTGLPPDSFL